MTAALAVWDGRVSPVFDVSREVLILTIVDGLVSSRHDARLDAPTAALRTDRLKELGVETLICGAISEDLHRELTSRGVRVIGFVAGEVDEVLAAFLAGRLRGAAFSMPGCCRRQHRYRGGCGGAGRRGNGRGRRGCS